EWCFGAGGLGWREVRREETNLKVDVAQIPCRARAGQAEAPAARQRRGLSLAPPTALRTFTGHEPSGLASWGRQGPRLVSGLQAAEHVQGADNADQNAVAVHDEQPVDLQAEHLANDAGGGPLPAPGRGAPGPHVARPRPC